MHPGNTSVVLNSSGAGTAEIKHNKSGFFWRIHQIAVDSTGPCITVELQVNSKPMSSKVSAATPVTASHEPAIDIGDHDVLQVVVSSGGDSNTVTVSYFYEEISGSA